MTAAFAGSYLGVNGTVIGAAVASVLSVAATALYTHSLQRTGDRMRAAVPATTRWLPARPAPAGAPPVGPADERAAAEPRRVPLLVRAGLATAVVFAAALAVLTGVEIVAGRPVSDLITGKTASGTTVFGSSRQSTATTPTPSVTVTVVPKVVVTTPTVTSTAPAVTVTPSPTTSTATPTDTPSGSATPSDTTIP
ncbi:MAG TPA: hypothetical protein VJ831_12025 [Jatrophihabitantaceae bacterium]|nr:hypothetical protein [Jatrophihabitantaceae bacterium]